MIDPTKRQLVYIVGPYTKGDVAQNVANAVEVFHEVTSRGIYAFCPHLFHYADLHQHRPWQYWMEIDFVQLQIMLKVAKVSNLTMTLIRLEGESTGSDMEVALAKATAIAHEVPLEVMSYQEWRARNVDGKINREGVTL